jgi:hypothetical protein
MMKYRNIPYTIRTLIKPRRGWLASIRPPGPPIANRIIIGRRGDAIVAAEIMIDTWLKENPAQDLKNSN